MPLKLANVGEAAMLEMVVNKTAPADLVIGLYTNDKTPADADVLSDYTEMGAVQGYTAKTLTGASWGTPTTGNPSEIAYAAQTWTFNGTGGAVNIYGYFVKKSTILLWAERLSNPPFVAQNNGDQLVITPKFTLQSAN